MKLSAWHKIQGNVVSIVVEGGKYDLVYKSKVFTYLPEVSFSYAAKQTIQGGTGYKLFTSLSDEVEHICPDYSLYGCTHAYGFLTRGCIRKCPWCVVPEKEGMLRKNASIDEFLGKMDSAVLMDNNVLASDWGLSQIEYVVGRKIKIDFNQGLDARIIAGNPEIAKLLGKVSWLKPLRMACDQESQMDSVAKATEMLRKAGATPRQYFVYVLVKDLPDALKRVNFLKKLKLDPFAQPYINFEEGKVDRRLKQFARWVNCRQLRNVSWEDYKYGAYYVSKTKK